MMSKKTLRRLEWYYHDDPTAEARARFAFSLLKNEAKDKRILDVGCGHGLLLAKLRQVGFRNLFGVDISPKCVRACARIGIRARRADIERGGLPYANNTFDIVIASEIFEHLFDPKLLLDDIRGVLRTDGYCIFSFPNELNIIARLRVLFGGEIHDPAAVGSHIRFFKPKGVMRFLKDGRFMADRMWGVYLEKKFYRFVPGIPFLAAWLPSLFARNIYVRAVKK